MEIQSIFSGQQGQLCVAEKHEDNERTGFLTEEASSCSHKSIPIHVTFNHKVSNARFEKDKERLLKILPRELWYLIFEKMEQNKHSDLENVRNCSLFFRELLASKRVKLLFQNVWDILSSWKYKHHFYTFNTNYGLEDDLVRLWSSIPIQPGLFHKEQLKLRLVCRPWSNTIDKRYECRSLPLWCYDSTKSWGQILPKFEATHGSSAIRNPFIKKSIIVHWGEGEVDEFVSAVLSILDKYGHHFWHCEIYSEESIATCYLGFREILQRMPHLRTVHIRYSNIHGGDKPLTAAELQNIETQANANPFPFLKELQELRVNDLPAIIFQHFIRVNPHVSGITLDTVSTMIPGAMDQRVIELYASLSSLKSLTCHIEVLTDFLANSTTTQVNWPLTNLHLKFPYKDAGMWRTLFSVLENKFKNSLTDLTLHLPRYLIHAREYYWTQKFIKGKALRLELPNLNRLKLRMLDFASFDFLLPMKNLSFLDIYIELLEDNMDMKQVGFAESANGCEIKVWRYIQTPLKSNIWTVLPKLERFCCRVDTPDQKLRFDHTRREWNNMQ